MARTSTGKARPAREDDADGVAVLLSELGYAFDPGTVRERLRNLASAQDGFLVVDEGAVLGLIGVHAIPLLHARGSVARITALVVRRDARGRGIGRALVAAAETFARKAGCVRMEVTSGDHRFEAHEFYEALGYYEDERRFTKSLRGQRKRPVLRWSANEILVLGLSFDKRITAQHDLMQRLFDAIGPARIEYDRLSIIAQQWAGESEMIEMVGTDLFGETETNKEASRAVAEDSAASMVLIAYTSFERAMNNGAPTILEMGDEVALGVTFPQAIWTLANGYRHFGEWARNDIAGRPLGRNKDRAVFAALNIDPKSSNAAMLFVERYFAGRYEIFEEKWRSVVPQIHSLNDRPVAD